MGVESLVGSISYIKTFLTGLFTCAQVLYIPEVRKAIAVCCVLGLSLATRHFAAIQMHFQG